MVHAGPYGVEPNVGLVHSFGNQSVIIASTLSHCTKVETSTHFNSSKYKPDGRVFELIPKKSTCDFLSAEDEQLAVDLLWLDAHAHPEPSFGDYLPSGMPMRLGNICRELLPPFAPTRKGVARPQKKVIALSHQNRREAVAPYKRMVLSLDFKECIQEKSRSSVTWVEPSSEALVDNVRNRVFDVGLVALRHAAATCAPRPCG